jgi:hypothetical protein
MERHRPEWRINPDNQVLFLAGTHDTIHEKMLERYTNARETRNTKNAKPNDMKRRAGPTGRQSIVGRYVRCLDRGVVHCVNQ